MLPNKEGKKMPPKFKFTREEIIQAALDLTRESGIAAVTARGLGAKLGSSVKPIFSLFENMEEVQNEAALQTVLLIKLPGLSVVYPSWG